MSKKRTEDGYPRGVVWRPKVTIGEGPHRTTEVDIVPPIPRSTRWGRFLCWLHREGHRWIVLRPGPTDGAAGAHSLEGTLLAACVRCGYYFDEDKKAHERTERGRKAAERANRLLPPTS